MLSHQENGLLQVRDYEFDQELQENQSEAAKTLKSTADAKRSQLEQWSSSAYGEVCFLVVSIHLIACRVSLRSFRESSNFL